MRMNFRGILSTVLSMGIVGSTLPVQVFAEDADISLKDDFESYEVSADYVTGAGTTVSDGVWVMSNICGYENKGGSKIVEDASGNKYLGVKGSGNTIYSTSRVLVNYTPNCSFLGNNVKAEVDLMRNDFRNQEGGLRFMVSNNEKDYYEIYTGINGGKIKLRKVVNNAEAWSRELTTFNWDSGVWYSVTLANDGDALLWSVTDKSNAENSENGRIIDKDMFELRGGAAKYRLSFIGDDYIYFDNFSLNNIEPDTANYVHQSLIASDNFESYEVMAEEQHAAVETVGSKWSSSPTYKGSSSGDTYMGSQVIDTGSKALKLKGYGSSWPSQACCLNYVGDLSGIGDYVKMSVDMHAYSTAMPWDQKGGIRFIAHNDDRNYYTLYTNGYNGKTYFEKVVDGDVVFSEAIWSKLTVGESYYNYTMEKIGNDIKCTVINKSQGTNVADYTYTDWNVFDPAELDETYQLMVFNNANYCFDNFSLTAITNIYSDGTEPDNVLYRDIASEADREYNSEYKYESYTFDSPKRIRKIVAEGVTASSPISVYLLSSPEDEEWIKWGELTEDGSILNTTSNTTDRCLILSNDSGDSDFSINKIKILIDEDKTEYTIKNDETVSLYPRLAGADCTEAWVVADTKRAVVTNGVFKAAGFGETTATAENSGKSVSVKLNVNLVGALYEYEEDFEDYDVMDSELQGPDKKVGDWRTSNVYKGWDNGLKIQTVSDNLDGGKVLAFSGTYNHIGAIVHRLKSVKRDKPFVFKADLRGTSWQNQAVAMRFCVSENEQTYYELRANGESNHATPCFNKVVGGAVEYSDAAQAELNANIGTAWLTFEMMADGNIITYSIKNSDGTVLWDGSYVDYEPLAFDDKISFAAEGDPFYYANNITAGSIDEFLVYESEPNTIMYIDAVAGKPVYSSNNRAGILFDRDGEQSYSFDGNVVTVDMIDKYIIRRIKAADAEGTIDVYISADNSTWYYLMPLTAEDGVMDGLNTFTADSYRYIKFVSENGKASEINVLAESDEAAVRVNSKLYLTAHIDGADVEDAAWSCSDADYAEADGGVVIPQAVTDNPIEITATDIGTSAKISVSVTDAYSIVNNGNGTCTVTLGSSYYKDGASFIVAGRDVNNLFAGAEIIDTEFVNSDVDALSFTFNVSDNTDSVNIFCWDGGVSNMKPLCTPITYSVE